MDKVIASKNFTLNNVDYLKGEKINVKNFDEVIKLNTFGLIVPLTHEDLVLIEREFKNKNKEVEHEL